jgi:serine/threonine-protein kinase
MLDHKYRVDQLLAVGGMGAVYIGTHTKLRKRVAIKVLNPQLSSPLMVERFHREAITASQIGHEGIAQVTDLGTSNDGEPFLVMELLEGDSLAKRLKATGAMPIEAACTIGAAILSPLDAAHRAGIVHRDLKPDNVFLVRQSRGEIVKLLDFGISRATGLEAEFRLTTTGLVLGTPYYMSPEQARGEHEVNHLADIYAFGVILYEMLCGQVPIQGDNYNQLMFKVMSGDYRPARTLRPDLPRELEQIIAAAIALDPQDRPQSAAALEQALVPFCGSALRDLKFPAATPSFQPAVTPITAPTAVHRSNRPAAIAPVIGSGRRRLVMGLIASMAVVGGVAAIVVTNRDTTVVTNRDTTVETALSLAKEFTADVQALDVQPTTAQPTPPPRPAALPTDAKPTTVEPKGPPASSEIAIAPSKTSTITLRFSVAPPSARIYLDGSRLRSNEIVVPKDDSPHKVHISAPGFVPYDETITFDETQKLAIDLSRSSRAIRATKSVSTSTANRGSDKIESQSPYD